MPGRGPFTPWQKMVSMALFCAVGGGLAQYEAADDDCGAFVW
jgi:hypothetical protein